ncbi:unnamed protein product [Urochloa humidicola]
MPPAASSLETCRRPWIRRRWGRGWQIDVGHRTPAVAAQGREASRQELCRRRRSEPAVPPLVDPVRHNPVGSGLEQSPPSIPGSWCATGFAAPPSLRDASCSCSCRTSRSASPPPPPSKGKKGSALRQLLPGRRPLLCRPRVRPRAASVGEQPPSLQVSLGGRSSASGVGRSSAGGMSKGKREGRRLQRGSD